MNEDKLTQKVMGKLVSIERKRVRAWMWWFGGVLGGLVLVGLTMWVLLGVELNRRELAQLLTLLGEDKEIVWEYGREVISTVAAELPYVYILGGVAGVVLLFLWLGINKARRETVSQKRKQLIEYDKRMGKTGKNNWWVWIAAVALVLGAAVILRSGVGLGGVKEEGVGQEMPEATGTGESEKTVELVILEPVASEAAVTTPKVKIAGRTAPGAEVFVNEIELTADEKGNFEVFYSLEEGENYILVVANDEGGDFAEEELVVVYTP